jgi:hypothetical protein
MKIQSISIVIPTKGCVNKCKFCVSCMHDNPYVNSFDEIAYRKRIKYAKINNVNTLILTGTGEALQNTDFLCKLKDVLDKEHHPFPNVEIQTTGVMLEEAGHTSYGSSIGTSYEHFPNIELLKQLGVNTISLSVSDIFSDENNIEIIGMPRKLQFNLQDQCNFIKDQGFNLRLSLNMTSAYNKKRPTEILGRCKELGADQITFRQLYHGNDNSDQTKWVKKNAMKYVKLENLREYIGGGYTLHGEHVPGAGKMLYRLPFGPMAFSIMGMSTVIDNNCMSKNDTTNLKYVILRENGKLYCQWDDEGSLIF